MKKDIRLILGSVDTDAKNANILLAIWSRLGIRVHVSGASCHWHTGDDENGFVKFIKEIPENLIVFIGGLSLAAPGIIETINKVNDHCEKIVFAIPTDKAARSAIEDLPRGTTILTSGLNSVSLGHSLDNNAIAVAKIAILMMPMRRRLKVAFTMSCMFSGMRNRKPIVKNVKLIRGLIPIIEKKKEA